MEGAVGDGGFVAEVYARHKRSPQPESQHLCAVLGAVVEVLQAEGMPASPTALFAALMSSLEKEDTQASVEVTTAICSLLAMVLGRVPDSVLRSKFSAAAHIVASVIEKHHTEASPLKVALQCLSQLLAALDPSDWPSAARPFGMLLAFLADSRPKVRRVAASGLVEALAALRGGPAATPASEAVLKVCQRILPGPEAAARAAAAAPNKKRQEAEAAIAQAVQEALHLLGALKQAAPLLAGREVASLCSMLLKLYILRQPLVTRHTTAVLAAVVASPLEPLPPAALADLLRAVLGAEAAWDRKDADTVMALTRLVEEGFCRLHDADASLCAARLPSAFHALVLQLAAPQEGVRFGTAQSLRKLLSVCLDPSAVAGGGEGDLLERGAMPGAASVVAAMSSALGVRFEDAWPTALPVVGELFKRLGPSGAQLADSLLSRLGELCGAAAEADPESGAPGAAWQAAADAAMGVALRSLQPEAVLRVLPLELEQAIQGTSDGRSWLLPLMRQHVRGARLGLWGSALLPTARAMGDAAGAAAAAAPPRRVEALQLRALELQLWATLPAFCDWPQDMADAFSAHAPAIGAAFQNRTDLHAPICNALARLCRQNRRALQAHGVLPPDPSAAVPRDDDEDDDEAGGAAAGPADGDVPPHYTREVAERNVAVLRGFAKNWLPLLFNAFLARPEQRGVVAAAISAYAAVADPQALAFFFRAVIKKLIKVTEDAQADVPPPDALKEGGETPTERRCTFLELALCLAPGLDAAGAATLWKAAQPCLQEREQAVQKKAYKVAAYLCTARPDFLRPNFQAVLDALLVGVTSAQSAAKRHRLAALSGTILMLRGADAPAVDLGEASGTTEAEKREQIVATLVSEIVLCVKEVNRKTRAAAYELLVRIGRAMEEAQPAALPPPMGDDGESMGVADLQAGGLQTLFTMVLGGLVGATPHMVSASVMALARLLHEFGPALSGLAGSVVPPVLMLLRSKSREVVKAVLGFVKVAALRLPVEALQAQLAAMVTGILLWSEDPKNKFRLKVRVILERLARRVGFPALEAVVPEADRRLLAAVRKEASRRERGTKSEAGSEMDWEEDGADAKSRGTGLKAKTASEWGHTKIFGGADGATEAGRTARTGKTARTLRQGGVAGAAGKPSARSERRAAGAAGSGARLPGDNPDDPVDLLDSGAARRLARTAAAGGSGARKVVDDFERDDRGKMVIKEDAKRKRGSGYDSDDSDFDDLRHIHGASAALRAGAGGAAMSLKSLRLGPASAAAPSLAGGRSAKSAGGRTARTAGGRTAVSTKTQPGRRPEHTADRYAPKKKGTGGDVKGGSKLEPYAYWPLDRKLLNRRRGKVAVAQQGMAKVVGPGSGGPLRGAKAKRAKR